MNILAVDPGSRYTGIATRINGIYETVELLDYTVVWKLVAYTDFDLVLCENFTAVAIAKYGLTTVRIIGGIEALCLSKNIPFMTQQNVRRLKYKAKAKEMIIAAKGKMIRDHEQDAMAHLLCWEAETENATASI